MTPITVPLWSWVALFALLGWLATTAYQQWREIRQYRALMKSATDELRQCERVIRAASAAIRSQP